MKNELRISLVCTALVAVVLFFVARWTDHAALGVISKPVPVLAMAAILWTERRDRVGHLIAVGLLAGAVGDVLLELDKSLFIPGLVAFLVDHLLVTGAFFAEESRPRLLRAAPFALFGGAMVVILGPGLGAMSAPVGAYTLVIGLMMWRAAARLPAEAPPSLRQWAGLVGAVVFAFSDSMIAIDTFYADLYDRGEAVMMSYWLGQLLIMSSVYPKRPN